MSIKSLSFLCIKTAWNNPNLAPLIKDLCSNQLYEDCSDIFESTLLDIISIILNLRCTIYGKFVTDFINTGKITSDNTTTAVKLR